MARTREQAALIDRKLLFGNPSRIQGRISPDGTTMSFRAPLDGVLNVWVGPVRDFDAVRPVTRDTGRGIPAYFWALDSAHILYIYDRGGDENFHLYSVDLASGDIIDLSPFEETQAQIMAQDEKYPGVAVVGMNDRDQRWHDVYRVDLNTAERTLLLQNDGYRRVYLDNALQVRMASKPREDGGFDLFLKDDDDWTLFASIAHEDALITRVLGFDADNTGIYMIDSRGRDKAALTHVDVASGESTVLATSDRVDIADVLIDPRTHSPVGYSVNYYTSEWTALDDEFTDDFANLNRAVEGDYLILATTLDASKWSVYVDDGDRSPVSAVYDRNTGELEELFVIRPDLEGLTLSRKHGVVIRSRDGKDLVSYLTLPAGSDPDGDARPDEAVPMVLLVHGGPWGRDTLWFSGLVQWLANRGYAVLQVNFRASPGFGKAFINAGNKEWAAAMHGDLIDAVQWAIDEGITTSDKVAIMGGSYGGYATLVGLTFTPETFACGVDICGPSNLVTLLNSHPPYWTSVRRLFAASIGDIETGEGRALLKERSPLTYVDRISRPLLIGQGANDPRCKQAESDQIVAAMQEKGLPVTYVLYPDEGHGFLKPENRLSFYAVAEAFLAECLGGRYQPVEDDFNGSSIEVPHGAALVPGVQAALANFEREVTP